MKTTKTFWLFFVNFLILQWLFIRLAFKYDTETNVYLGLTLVGPIIPMSGWIWKE